MSDWRRCTWSKVHARGASFSFFTPDALNEWRDRVDVRLLFRTSSTTACGNTGEGGREGKGKRDSEHGRTSSESLPFARHAGAACAMPPLLSRLYHRRRDDARWASSSEAPASAFKAGGFRQYVVRSGRPLARAVWSHGNCCPLPHIDARTVRHQVLGQVAAVLGQQLEHEVAARGT